MSAFGIFALILTIAYIIYFSVVIVRDVAVGRKAKDDGPQAETFDTSFMEDQPVKVAETKEGFSIGDNEISATPVAEISSDLTEELENKSAETEALKTKLAETMPEEVEVIAEVSLDENEMMDSLQGLSATPDAKNIWVKRISAEENNPTDNDAGGLDHY